MTLSSGLTVTEIGQVISDIKSSGNYPVLDRIGLYSSSGTAAYDKVTLFTKEEYRTPEGREALKTSKKPVITSAQAGDAQVTLEWTGVANASKYRVYKYINGTFTKALDTTNLSCTVTGLTNGTKYGFLVLAYVDGKFTPYTVNEDVVYATPVNS